MLLEFETRDVDELAECMSTTEQTYRQLQSGQFLGRYRILELEGVSIAEEFHSHSVEIRAAVSPGWCAQLVPLHQQGDFTLEGHAYSQRDAFVGQPNTLASMTFTPEFHCMSVEIELQTLHEFAEACHIHVPDLPTITRLQSDLPFRNALNGAISAAAAPTSDAFRTTWRDEILRGYLAAISAVDSRPKSLDRTTLIARRKAALTAAEHIHSQPVWTCSLAELCRVVGCSERSLRQGFLDVFGVTPHHYAKILRLSAARRDLLQRDTSNATVSGIALGYGFTQFAHFATDYRRHFGESPSQTLAKVAWSRMILGDLQTLDDCLVWQGGLTGLGRT